MNVTAASANDVQDQKIVLHQPQYDQYKHCNKQIDYQSKTSQSMNNNDANGKNNDVMLRNAM